MTSFGDFVDMEVLRDIFVPLVKPFYLELLGGGFARPHPNRNRLTQAIVTAAKTISDERIDKLLTNREWRGRLGASWFIGLSGRAHFVPIIGKLLLASELAYAGQGYCMALALIGGDESAQLLRTYLEIYLPPMGRFYNQDWAIGALAHIEGNPAAEYLESEYLRDANYAATLERGAAHFGTVIDYLRQSGMISNAE